MFCVCMRDMFYDLLLILWEKLKINSNSHLLSIPCVIKIWEMFNVFFWNYLLIAFFHFCELSVNNKDYTSSFSSRNE